MFVIDASKGEYLFAIRFYGTETLINFFLSKFYSKSILQVAVEEQNTHPNNTFVMKIYSSKWKDDKAIKLVL